MNCSAKGLEEAQPEHVSLRATTSGTSMLRYVAEAKTHCKSYGRKHATVEDSGRLLQPNGIQKAESSRVLGNG